MKKVRKSLALDVVDCKVMPKSRRKSLRTEIRNSIMVSVYILAPTPTISHPWKKYWYWGISLLHNNIHCYLWFSLSSFFFFVVYVAWQEEPVLVALGSSASKQHESILDQGFLLGPSDGAIFPSMQQPLPASFTFFFFRIDYKTFINPMLGKFS